ncbi:MAG: fumarylacetoacetate hydrolase family protein [Symbiobacteriaceae bacterium]
MILVTYRTPGGLALGVRTDRGILDVAAACRRLACEGVPRGVDQALAMGLDALEPLAELVARAQDHPDLFRAEADLTLGPPVPRPGKILCVGLNYRAHAAEARLDVPAHPVLFSKFGNAIAGPGEPVVLPEVAEQYDYEAELVVVIGRRARRVPAEAALDCVLGYCNGNDLSARDLQMRTSQWLLGKTLDGFLPVGPYLVTRDEVPDPQNLRIRLWRNGELRQDGHTRDMLFPVADLIAYISRYITLEPGDIIATGTPEGVIMGLPEKDWLKPGDVVAVEIDGLGRLENTFAVGE